MTHNDRTFTGPGPNGEPIEYEIEEGELDLENEEVHDSFGNRIDRAYVDAAVAHVHATTGVGRPSLSGDGTSPRVSFRISEADREAARERAAREHKTVSQLAREAFHEYLQAG